MDSNSGGVPQPTACLGNTEKFWVEILYNEFGGSFYLEKPKYLGAKYMFRWRVSGKKAEHFLQTLQPFLVGEKARNLDLCLEVIRLKSKKQSGNQYSYDAETLSRMKELYDKYKSLKGAAAETNRRDALTMRSDSPTLEETPARVTVRGKSTCSEQLV